METTIIIAMENTVVAILLPIHHSPTHNHIRIHILIQFPLLNQFNILQQKTTTCNPLSKYSDKHSNSTYLKQSKNSRIVNALLATKPECENLISRYHCQKHRIPRKIFPDLICQNIMGRRQFHFVSILPKQKMAVGCPAVQLKSRF